MTKHTHQIAEVQRQRTSGRKKKRTYRKPSAHRVAELRGRGLRPHSRDGQAAAGHNRSSTHRSSWGR